MICSCPFTVARRHEGVLVEVPLVATGEWTGEAFVDVRLMTVENDRLPWTVADLAPGERDRLRATLERDRDERQRAAAIELAARARAS